MNKGNAVNSNSTAIKVFECPECNSTNVKTEYVIEKFKHGVAKKFVELEANIPLRKCQDCGFEYTDFEAEDVQHEAICHYLGVMTPNEIIALRKSYGLTRAQFAELTQIGEASLARWETGEFIQNAAYDNYLRLLYSSKNIELLRNKRTSITNEDQEQGRPANVITGNYLSEQVKLL